MRCNAALLLALALLLSCHGIASIELPKVTSVERSREASIAYFLQISDATLTLLPRLLRTIWHASNVYIVHFDKKIPAWQRKHARAALFRKGGHYETNVRVMESEVVTYRGISMVLNLLNAMQAALDLGEWDYFINISGSDYPLVSAENQRRLLGTNDFMDRNRSFFSFASPDWWEESKKYRYDRLFTDTSLSFNDSTSEVVDSYRDQPIATIANFTYVAAEAWMILHRSFVRFTLEEAFARRMLLAFAYSLEPEEHYFATLAYNYPTINSTNVPHSMRYVSWWHNEKHSGQHPYYIDEQEADGKKWVFRDSLVQSGCLFARKIRMQNSGFLAYVDNHLNGMGKNPNDKDVQMYLRRATYSINCIAKLSSADVSDGCFDIADFT